MKFDTSLFANNDPQLAKQRKTLDHGFIFILFVLQICFLIHADLCEGV